MLYCAVKHISNNQRFIVFLKSICGCLILLFQINCNITQVQYAVTISSTTLKCDCYMWQKYQVGKYLPMPKSSSINTRLFYTNYISSPLGPVQTYIFDDCRWAQMLGEYLRRAQVGAGWIVCLHYTYYLRALFFSCILCSHKYKHCFQLVFFISFNTHSLCAFCVYIHCSVCNF